MANFSNREAYVAKQSLQTSISSVSNLKNDHETMISLGKEIKPPAV